jgi:hypothetical protein
MCQTGGSRDARSMTNTATFRRSAAAAGLVTASIITAVSTVLAPEFPSEYADRLGAMAAGGTSATVSAVAFTLAQLPLLAGILGIGHLLRRSAPRLSNIGTTLAVVGIFGHSVVGGVMLVQLELAQDVPNRETHAAVIAGLESGPIGPFMGMGLIGTVLGLLLLSIGVFRAGLGPRWVGPTLWAFLVVEFVGSAVSGWAAHLAVLLYGAAFFALALAIARSPESAWAVPADEQPSTEPVVGRS